MTNWKRGIRFNRQLREKAKRPSENLFPIFRRPLCRKPPRIKRGGQKKQKNAHILANVCQVYKGEIEEKLSNGCCQPSNAAHYRRRRGGSQAHMFGFCENHPFFSKKRRKRKNPNTNSAESVSIGNAKERFRAAEVWPLRLSGSRRLPGRVRPLQTKCRGRRRRCSDS